MNKAQDRFADQIMWMLHEKRDKSINVWKKAGFEWITEPWPRLQAENSLIPPELMDEVMRILREHTFSLQNQLTILKNCDRVTAACDGHEFYVTDVVHHLNKLVADLERRIRNGMLKTTIMSLLVVVFVVVVLSARSQSTTPNQTPPEPPPGLWESIKIVTDQIPVFLAVPVGMFVFVMESIVSFMFLQDEVNKFNDVLDNTDEPGPPRSSRP